MPPDPVADPRNTAEPGSILTSALAPIVRVEAARSDNPWGLAHGIVAFGIQFEADSGRPAWQEIGTLLEKVDNARGWDWPAEIEGRRVEPHDGMMARVLSADPPPGNPKLKTDSDGPTLDVVIDGLRGALIMGDVSLRDLGWVLGASCSAVPIEDDQVRKELEGAVKNAVATLGTECQGIEDARQRGDQVLRKDKQGIFAHPCGGQHFLQGAVACAQNRIGGGDVAAQVRHQVDLHLWRFDAEMALYRQQYQRIDVTDPNGPALRLILDIQQLKFAGHTAETIALARQAELYAPTELSGLTERYRSALIAADEAVARLGDAGVLHAMGVLRTNVYQSYLDIVGDGSHALHAIAVWDQAPPEHR